MNRKLKRELQIVDYFKNAERNTEKRHYELNKQKSLYRKKKKKHTHTHTLLSFIALKQTCFIANYKHK